MDSVKVPRMNTVGPTTKRKSTSRVAATALALESHLMPLSTPLTAETTKQPVSTAITTTARFLLPPPSPKTLSMPPVICRAPSPSDVADPKSVAKIAITSIALPGPWLARSPSSG